MIDYTKQNGYMGADENTYVLSVEDVLRMLRKRAWIIVLLTIILTGVTVGYSLLQPPVYRSSIKILVGQERAIADNPVDVNGLEEVTATVAEAINSRPIADSVIEQEGLQTDPGTFLEDLEVAAIEDTQFVTVGYKDSDPGRAQRVVNAVGDVSSNRISEASSNITVTVWERAGEPGGPIRPNPLRNGLLAVMIGVVLGTGLAFLMEVLDDSWRSPEEAEQVTGIPTLGVIPALATTGNGNKRTEVLAEDQKNGEETR